MGEAVLITGPARSGKTAHCLRICRDAVSKAGPGEVVYLVPGTEGVREIESVLLLGPGPDGVLGSVVMDFVGIAARVLRRAGSFPVRRIGPLERRYLILRVVREASLRFFEEVRNTDGFADVVRDFIAELKRGMISPEDFLQGCEAAAGQGDVAAEKVKELHAIYRAYQDALELHGAYDGDGLLWMAAESLRADPSLLSSVEVLLVDGFATYTPAEFEILSLLVRRASKSHITLCYARDREEVFAFVEGTYSRLRELCAAREVVLSGERPVPAELLHLERALFEGEESQKPAGDRVAIVPASDLHREVQTVAREIERIRTEQRLEYSDFMVILRDVGEYSRYIAEVFGDRRIPFHISASTPLSDEPFIRAVLSALRLVGGDFRWEGVLAVLKNSFFNTDGDVAAAIENYVDESGLWDEESFRQDWTEMTERVPDVSRINTSKAQFLEVVDRLRSEAGEVSSAEGFRDFVFGVVRALGLASGMGKGDGGGSERFRLPEDSAATSSSEWRSLGALSSLLDTMCGYVRLTKLLRTDYSSLLDMLERGLNWMPTPSLARRLNGVRVASIVGGPPAAAPVVFVCGLCERSFPREIVGEPFLKDRERRLINRAGKLVLEERLPLSAGERFFFYIAVSRATQKLILTHPAADLAGKELVRSHYVEEVARLFPDLKAAIEEDRPGRRRRRGFKEVADAGELRFFIAEHLSREIEEQNDEVEEEQIALGALAYNALLTSGKIGCEQLIYEAPTAEARLPGELCEKLKEGDAYRTSVSELETFAQCPFRHFCEHRLRLKEPRRYRFGHAEEGSLYHDVLARLYRGIYVLPREEKVSTDGSSSHPAGGIESVPAEELAQKLTFLVDDFIAAGYSRLFRNPRMEVRRRTITARIKDFVFKEVENERTNATRPSYFELSFGRGRGRESADTRSTTECLSISSREGPFVQISGRMDRVDVFEGDGERFGVVVDYKRSGVKGAPDLQRGTVLQPGIYMLALRELFGIKPAGAFYFSIFAGRKRGIFAAEENDRISGQGDVSRADRASYREIQELMQLNSRQALEYVQRIVEGDIGVRPADLQGCRGCPCSSICRIADEGSRP